ncbi:MAG: hypothetical protein FWB85_11045, partial [Chitinispirillia bacterium]|nr:hypothetical protein [Chitinispirillia bacterium]
MPAAKIFIFMPIKHPIFVILSHKLPFALYINITGIAQKTPVGATVPGRPQRMNYNITQNTPTIQRRGVACNA